MLGWHDYCIAIAVETAAGISTRTLSRVWDENPVRKGYLKCKAIIEHVGKNGAIKIVVAVNAHDVFRMSNAIGREEEIDMRSKT